MNHSITLLFHMCVSAGEYTRSRWKNAFFSVGHSQNNLKETVMGDYFPSSFSFTRRDIYLTKSLPQFNAIQQTFYWKPMTWGWSLGWEDALEKERLPTPVFWVGEFHGLYSPLGRRETEKEIATYSSTLAWKIPWTEEPGRLQSDTTERLDLT